MVRVHYAERDLPERPGGHVINKNGGLNEFTSLCISFRDVYFIRQDMCRTNEMLLGAYCGETVFKVRIFKGRLLFLNCFAVFCSAFFAKVEGFKK